MSDIQSAKNRLQRELNHASNFRPLTAQETEWLAILADHDRLEANCSAFSASCSFCGWRKGFGNDGDARDAAGAEHRKSCPKHPMRQLERDLAEKDKRIARLNENLESCKQALKEAHGWRRQKSCENADMHMDRFADKAEIKRLKAELEAAKSGGPPLFAIDSLVVCHKRVVLRKCSVEKIYKTKHQDDEWHYDICEREGGIYLHCGIGESELQPWIAPPPAEPDIVERLRTNINELRQYPVHAELIRNVDAILARVAELEARK